MGVPETPISPPQDDESPERKLSRAPDKRPEIVVTGDHVPITLKTNKRKRNSLTEPSGKKSPKRVRTDDGPSKTSSQEVSQVATADVSVNYRLTSEEGRDGTDFDASSKTKIHQDNTSSHSLTPEHSVPHGLRNTNLRDTLQFLVNDLLKVGGRPDSAIARETEHGEEIEVSIRAPTGEEKVKLVKWTVDPAVPDTILIDEKDLQKMISCVFLNALKFTEEGHVTLTARLSPRLRYVIINICDTGPGIPQAFIPNLFKAFAKEDASTTRASEGLGLGLLVAKGLARKLGGDLTCTRAETFGPNRGTEFEMRVPCTPSDAVSRPETPFSSPTPSHRSLYSADPDHGPTSSESYHNHHLTTENYGSPRPNSRHRHHYDSRKSRSPPDPPSSNPNPTSKPHRSPPTLSLSDADFDRKLAQKYPLTFLVVEDNKINRKLLVNMLNKLGYGDIYEAYDGADAVRVMRRLNAAGSPGEVVERERELNVGGLGSGKMVDVVLMDLWMPYMDGYEATEKILSMDYSAVSPAVAIGGPVQHGQVVRRGPPTILAVTADVTGGALERAEKVGMKGFLSKPYKLRDLQKLILEYCASLPASSSVAAA